MHTRLTVYGQRCCSSLGTVAFLALEWTNPGTLGALSPWGKVVGGVTGGVVPRTAGFNSVDYGQITPETMAVNYVLMFIGGGSAGTAGGIKVTTFFLLAYVIWSEVRGERDTNIAHRKIGGATLRQALTVVLLAIAVIAIGTTGDPAGHRLRPRRRAVRGDLGVRHRRALHRHHPRPAASAQLTLMALMFVGRVGTITVASALALKTRHHHFHLPEERPVVG